MLAKTRRGSWLAPSLMGFWKDNQKHEIPFSLPSAARRRGGDPVVAYNQRVFAVGDLEWLLTPGLQSPGGKKLREALHRWWKEGR